MNSTLLLILMNFCIFIMMWLGFEYFISMRLKRSDVYYLTTEVKGFKIFMILLAASVMVLDYFGNHASSFPYAAIFFSYAFTYKEIGSDGVVINLRRHKTEQIDFVALDEKKGIYHLTFGNRQRTFEMFIRAGQAEGFISAVEKLQSEINKKRSR